MTGYYGNEKILARGKTVSMGIDVHKENWHVSVLVAARSSSMARSLGSMRRCASCWIGCSTVRSGWPMRPAPVGGRVA